MSIASLLNQVQQGEIVLPAIQREFVWPPERTLSLLDSMMRGYPIGTILLWETYSDIQYRKFISDYRSENLHTYSENTVKKKLKLVIDGQQRLQSLYIALYGTYEGNPLYFDIFSGREKDDVSEQKYIFRFSTQEAIEVLHAYILRQIAKPLEDQDNDFEVSYYVKVTGLFAMTVADRERFKDTLSKQLTLSDKDRIRLGVNISLLDQAISKESDLLKQTVVDQDLPNESVARKSDYDVLEIFVRVNTLNTRLSRSDLIFSMLKLNWKESATLLPEFVRDINDGNSLEINNDFVIRCLFAVSDLGSKFDINLLRKKTNINKLRANFQQCCDAIRAAVDFVTLQCWCLSSSVFGGLNTLIPFVYYLFYTKNHDIRNDQVAGVRKAFFLLGLARPFSRYGESRVGAYIRDDLAPKARKGDEIFPWENLIDWISYWEGINSFEELLQRNHLLTLHLVQGLSGVSFKYDRNSPEIDHIFPRSKLREKDYDLVDINHFANYWILARSKNQNKSNMHPRKYFRDVNDMELQRALIDRGYLDWRRYSTFIEHRKQHMIDMVTNKLGFRNNEFEG